MMIVSRLLHFTSRSSKTSRIRKEAKNRWNLIIPIWVSISFSTIAGGSKKQKACCLASIFFANAFLFSGFCEHKSLSKNIDVNCFSFKELWQSKGKRKVTINFRFYVATKALETAMKKTSKRQQHQNALKFCSYSQRLRTRHDNRLVSLLLTPEEGRGDLWK